MTRRARGPRPGLGAGDATRWMRGEEERERDPSGQALGLRAREVDRVFQKFHVKDWGRVSHTPRFSAPLFPAGCCTLVKARQSGAD